MHRMEFHDFRRTARAMHKEIRNGKETSEEGCKEAREEEVRSPKKLGWNKGALRRALFVFAPTREVRRE
jgi:hypothetical protein